MLHHGVVAFCGFSRQDVTDGIEKHSVVEPVDPFDCDEIDRLERAPWPVPTNDFRPIKADDVFGQSVDIAVADTFDRWLNARFSFPD